jgi:hypothetical protein
VILKEAFLGYVEDPIYAERRQETGRFAYKDAEENILGYVIRLEDRQGTKIIPTLTYIVGMKRRTARRWKGFGTDRPLYGLEQLAQKTEAWVLVVEGEKTAEAAKQLFSEYAVVTWSGGCGAVNKSDWSVLKDEIIIWPNNDKPGYNAAAKIADILKIHNAEMVHIVDLPSTLPHKWDLADPLPEGFSFVDLTKRPFKSGRKHKKKLCYKPPAHVEDFDKTVNTVAEKYRLQEYVEPSDKIQQLHIQFALKILKKLINTINLKPLLKN